MSFSSFISREVKFGEAALINLAASSLERNTAALEALVDAAVPSGVDAIVAAVEKADASLGFANAAIINGVLNGYKAQIESELSSAVAPAVLSVIPSVVAAMVAVASKLQTEALATK